jgi:hypothetical protein
LANAVLDEELRAYVKLMQLTAKPCVRLKLCSTPAHMKHFLYIHRQLAILIRPSYNYLSVAGTDEHDDVYSEMCFEVDSIDLTPLRPQ